MSYAIARIAKLKQGNLGGSGMHVSRGRHTPNADRSKFQDNQTLIGRENAHLPLGEVVESQIHSTPQRRKIRSDAVYAVEILLTASPEYFRPEDASKYGDYDSQRLTAWSDASVKWLEQEYGDKIVRAELHLDEATPHIHAYLVPTDENGQLNCKKMFGGREKLFAFQDSYAAATKHLGLERGVRDSQAEHTAVKDYYAVVNEASRELDLKNLQEIQAKAVAYGVMQKEHQELQRRLKMVVKQRDELAKRLAKSQASVKKQMEIDRGLVSPNRSISVAQVACELGLDPQTSALKYTSAIDLVMATKQTNLDGAAGWLTDKFGGAGAVQLAKERLLQVVSEREPVSFVPPLANARQWGDVKARLVDDLKLPTQLVERLHSEGLVYADKDGRTIFIQRDFEERATGATAISSQSGDLRGESMAGSGLSMGWCYFQSKPQDDIDAVAICDSPLEAMAYATLYPSEQSRLFLVAHEGGWVPGESLRGVEVVVATSARLENLPGGVEYHLPQSGSWVGDLQVYLERLVPNELQAIELDRSEVKKQSSPRNQHLGL